MDKRTQTLLARLKCKLEAQCNRPASTTKRGATLRQSKIRTLRKQIKAIETTGQMANWPDMEL